MRIFSDRPKLYSLTARFAVGNGTNGRKGMRNTVNTYLSINYYFQQTQTILLNEQDSYDAEVANNLVESMDQDLVLETINSMKAAGELVDVKGGQARRLCSRAFQLSTKLLRPLASNSWKEAIQVARKILQTLNRRLDSAEQPVSIGNVSGRFKGGHILAYSILAFKPSDCTSSCSLLPKFAELSQRQWEDLFAEGHGEEIPLDIEIKYHSSSIAAASPATVPLSDIASDGQKDRRFWHDINGRFSQKQYQSVVDSVIAVLLESPSIGWQELVNKFSPLLELADLRDLLCNLQGSRIISSSIDGSAVYCLHPEFLVT